MKQRWMALGAVVLSLVASACQAPPAGESSGGTVAQPLTSGGTKGIATNVLLVANLSEAEASCGCGDIIHSVRSAATRGVKMREVDTRNKDERAKIAAQHRILVSPTVLFLDDEGREITRFEGESAETVTAMKATLEKLATKQ